MIKQGVEKPHGPLFIVTEGPRIMPCQCFQGFLGIFSFCILLPVCPQFLCNASVYGRTRIQQGFGVRKGFRPKRGWVKHVLSVFFFAPEGC